MPEAEAREVVAEARSKVGLVDQAFQSMATEIERLTDESGKLREALAQLLDEIIGHMKGEGWHPTEIEQRPYIIQARAALSSTGGGESDAH